MIKKDGKNVLLFKDDYAPAELMVDGHKVAGWVESEYEGKDIMAEETYNDVLDLTCKGEHTQKQYQGYNVLPFPYNGRKGGDIYTYRGVTFTVNDDGSVTINGTATGGEAAFHLYGAWAAKNNNFFEAGERITLSVRRSSNIGARLVLFQFNNGTSVTSTVLNSATEYQYASATISPYADGIDLYISVLDGTTLNNMVVYPMLEKGSTAHDYEPFVGGIPSPSPEYPQEIVPINAEAVVSTNLLKADLSGTQTSALRVIGDYKIRSLVQNEYYINILIMQENILEQIRKSINSGNILTFRSDTAHNSMTIVMRGTFEGITNTNREFSSSTNVCKYGKALTASLDHNILTLERIELRLNRTSVRNNDTETEYGELALYLGSNEDFAPYRTPQQLITDYKLYGSDGIYDTLEPCVLVDGEWKCRITRRWKEKTFNGSENWIFYSSGFCYTNIPDVFSPSKYTETLSSIFSREYISIAQNSLSTSDNAIFNNMNNTSVSIKDTTHQTSLSDWKTWLSTNNIHILYRLREPTIELHDPIMLHTNPYTTIIKGNTEMVAKIKTVDYSTGELLSMLDEHYNDATEALT